MEGGGRGARGHGSRVTDGRARSVGPLLLLGRASERAGGLLGQGAGGARGESRSPSLTLKVEGRPHFVGPGWMHRTISK